MRGTWRKKKLKKTKHVKSTFSEHEQASLRSELPQPTRNTRLKYAADGDALQVRPSPAKTEDCESTSPPSGHKTEQNRNRTKEPQQSKES